jgi:hypothetical protein
MTLPFTPDEFFDVFAAYNGRLWPVVLMLWLVTAYAVMMLTRARPVRPWFIPGLLAFHWAWSGLAYHAAFFSRINPAAWVFAVCLCSRPGCWSGTASFTKGSSCRAVPPSSEYSPGG